MCKNHQIQVITLPPKNCKKLTDRYRYLKSTENGEKFSYVTEKENFLPFCIFGDLESILLKCFGPHQNTSTQSATSNIAKHVPGMMGYFIHR
jgi:hypothetical protein